MSEVYRKVIEKKEGGPKKIIVKVERGSGTIESDWELTKLEDGEAFVEKPNPKNEEEILKKVISQNHLEELNPELKSKFVKGEKVSVKRGSGEIENDWIVGDEFRIVEGQKLLTVFKGNFPPVMFTPRKVVSEEELLKLNK